MIRYKESSLSRIWQHVTDVEKSFGVVSAFRQDLYSEEENLKKHEALKKEIRSMIYGYIEQKSGYTYKDEITGIEHMAEEKSCFVPNISFEDTIKLGRKYEQESILYKDKEGFGLFLCKNSKRIMIFKDRGGIYSLKKDDIKIAYSQLIRVNNNHKVKFSYIAEYYVPSMKDAYLSLKTKKITEAKWVKII